MEQLIDICLRHTNPALGTDKNTTHSYIEVYTDLLEKYRKTGNILEIGAAHGNSMRMWREYFTNGIVAGIDNIVEENIKPLLDDPKYKIVIHDATHDSILDYFKDIKFDVIIDDGSHKIHHQLKTFDMFKNHMNPGGVYIIEDIEDIDSTRGILESIHDNCQIIDRRSIKDRFDDILVVYKF